MEATLGVASILFSDFYFNGIRQRLNTLDTFVESVLQHLANLRVVLWWTAAFEHFYTTWRKVQNFKQK